MLVSTAKLLQQAQNDGYAIGAFNVYTLEGVRAITVAAESLNSPVMLQVLPSAMELGGSPLIALCLEACRAASVPMAVHLDHCNSEDVITKALGSGISSVMADGSHLAHAVELIEDRSLREEAAALQFHDRLLEAVDDVIDVLVGVGGGDVGWKALEEEDPLAAQVEEEKVGVFRLLGDADEEA